VTLLGFFLGQVDVIEKNLEIAILAIVAISALPIVLELLKARRARRTQPETDQKSAPASTEIP
jgi:membrane-associated protein